MNEYYIGGRGTGESYRVAQLAKERPKTLVLVPNLRSLDHMISLGVQPSQLRLPYEEWQSEFMLSGLY